MILEFSAYYLLSRQHKICAVFLRVLFADPSLEA